jgi:putative membrane protein
MKENRVIAGIAVFFLSGAVLHMIPELSPFLLNITDFCLFVVNLIVLYLVLKINSRGPFLIVFFSCFVFTYLSEVAGVHTGKVFGIYHYGSTMKLQALEVPLIIPFNWVMLVLGMTSIIQSIRLPSWLVPFLAAGGLVIFDFTMEPVAMELDYWDWQDHIIPFQNYFAWFIIALLVSSAVVLAKIKLGRKVLWYYIIVQWFFFLALNVFFRYFGA